MLVTAIHPDEARLTRSKYRWETKNILFYSSLAVLYIYMTSLRFVYFLSAAKTHEDKKSEILHLPGER